ncbi:zinc-binding dehydrogenase [Exiguobacterium sp. s189]|uniref:zinc-dependent alcohol dehydrogenase n=1 Tax=Exiguobacterium sp. s189 TaxID=2751263 RepID=UPI001BE95965|nr:medium chain dehydrogenase/reductase family protein [Exiguobacterium sp. s189]
MKAAVLHKQGETLLVQDVLEPKVKPKSAKVRITSTHVLSFTKDLFSGVMPVSLPTPYIPGPSAIGIIEEIGSGSHGLSVGQRVFCSPYITSKEILNQEQSILKGWFGLTPESEYLLDEWKDGSFAEFAVYPIENITPIDSLEQYDDPTLSTINYLSIAYEGLKAGNLQPGQTVLISGATGNMGSAAVLSALAMGAEKIFVLGRNEVELNNLQAISPHRISPIVLTTEDLYEEQITNVASHVDLVLDALGTVLNPLITSATIKSLRPRGTIVFIGGVFADIPVPYYEVLTREITIKGSFMYRPDTPKEIMNMIRANTLPMNHIKAYAFALENINEAIDRAAQLKSLNFSVVTPQQ